jgi:putative ABC transport system permease protein
MFIFKLLLKNAFRHKLRTLLTMVGLVVAISAFGLLRTIVDAWYAGVEGTSSTRLITRSAVSVGQALPRYYAERIRKVEGVSGVTWANWFGGIYIDRRNFFARFAVDGPSYFAIYPEYQITDAERAAFMADRQGAVIGRRLAQRFGWKVGDTIPLSGTLYPGNWSFTIRGIYASPDPSTNETHHDDVPLVAAISNESVRRTDWATRRADQVGIVCRRHRAIQVELRSISSRAPLTICFKNSIAETTDRDRRSHFSLAFVAMSQTVIIGAIRIVSYVVILIIMAVMANTMTMTARERTWPSTPPSRRSVFRPTSWCSCCLVKA